MDPSRGLALAQALVTLTVTGDHRTAAALAATYAEEYDPAELLVWFSRYAGLVLELLAHADALERSPAELAEAVARQIATMSDEDEDEDGDGDASDGDRPGTL